MRQQLALVASSNALVGAHGQGLSWVPFLPTGPSTYSALTEIMPERMAKQGTTAFRDWSRWARMCGVRYFRIFQPDAPYSTCPKGNPDFRVCGNMMADGGMVQMLRILLEQQEPECHFELPRGWRCRTRGQQFRLSSTRCNHLC